MADIIMSEVTELADPKLKSIATRVLRTLQLEVEKAVAHHAEPTNFPLDEDPDSVERLFLSRFNKLPPAKQRAATESVMASIKAPAAQRREMYGDLAQVKLHMPIRVAQQARVLAMPAELKFPLSHLTTLTQLHSPSLAAPAIAVAPAIGAQALQQTTDKLEFRIHKVTCHNETNVEPGNDEISMYGIEYDESGDTRKIPPFNVGSNFNEGETKVFSPPKRLTFFNLREGGGFPKEGKGYGVSVGLAERDLGGLGDFLHKLWKKVDDRVLDYIAAAVGTAVGAVAIPGIGAIVGAATGWVVANVVRRLIGLFKDDMFTPFTATINIPSLNARWPGGMTNGPNKVITFKGHGGRYTVEYDWRLF
jgi:hypothetical protein